VQEEEGCSVISLEGEEEASAGVEMSSRAVTEVQKPKMIEGWLMKKSSAGGGQLIGAEWQKR
jgi:hypothetical protein